MSGDERPLLRVVRGEPDDAELAALTTVVAGLASATAPAETPEPRSTWGDPARRVRVPLTPGPGAWRASGLPR
ncbi:acyl-CoA carboxylase subunit epsilon [Umezawaea tangerina]|uniref:Acyl-CoA carboxylase epsilon subunit-like protein n=1 Tax=Umezawaea tangerina TaxID=84725 RepID=A0A2T0TDQ3_9PSEU|nr:acyl-CoA carboxylase subunit epsilon [Umezawaea tangerina]PRY43799.1 acyl-CoA carboxylase epsilon subunit-like protein [Umezawaea tangerina]